MHRLIAIAVLSFWAISLGGLAHLSLTGMLFKSPQGASEFQLLLSSTGQFQFMPVLLMIVVALFAWAIISLIVSNDETAFREVETHAYAGAIFLMGACSILAVVKFSIFALSPAILISALIVCVAASQRLSIVDAPEPEIDVGRQSARQMALGAAHNSLLTRISRRPLPGQQQIAKNISLFPIQPTNGGNS